MLNSNNTSNNYNGNNKSDNNIISTKNNINKNDRNGIHNDNMTSNNSLTKDSYIMYKAIIKYFRTEGWLARKLYTGN